ncbi:MAG: sigma-70 protein [Podoviridae sp. ctda_1]|nr:MAG: sigma-70 protein [Podoviridae sp. ctda_1]
MSDIFRPNRKATDAEIIRLNNCGLSLQTIGKMLGIHPSTVTIRLRSLGIEPADTRRSFMEDIFRALPNSEREWLSDQLNQGVDVKTYVLTLLRHRYAAYHQGNHNERSNESPERSGEDAGMVHDGQAEPDAA